MRDGLADVVEERRAARRLGRGPQLLGEDAGEVRALDQVVQDVLPVRGAEAKLADQLRQLGVQAVDVRLESCGLPLLNHPLYEVGLGLLVGLLDQRGMDPAVSDQALEREPGDLASDAVEAGENDRRGRLVDDHVNACELFERTDVAALAADDAPLHFI